MSWKDTKGMARPAMLTLRFGTLSRVPALSFPCSFHKHTHTHFVTFLGGCFAPLHLLQILYVPVPPRSRYLPICPRSQFKSELIVLIIFDTLRLFFAIG